MITIDCNFITIYSCKVTTIGVGLEIMSNTGDRFCATSISSFIFSFGPFYYFWYLESEYLGWYRQ